MRRGLTLLVALSAFHAVAQSDDVAKYLQAATALYENLEYGKALAQIQKAKAKAKTPDDEAKCAILEGIVLAEMGKDEKASTAFKEAFGIEPDLKLPVAVAPKIAQLADRAREQVKKTLAPTLAAKKAEDDRRAAELKLQQEEEQKRRQEALAKAAKDEEEQKKLLQPPKVVAKPAPASSVRQFSWIPGVFGLAAGGAAIACLLLANGQRDALMNAVAPLPNPAQVRDAGKTFNTLGIVATSVAVASIGAAIAMFIAGAPKDVVALVPTEQGASVVVAGRFDLWEGLR
jgi:tetratricopeptide (TPR) repeat protein